MERGLWRSCALRLVLACGMLVLWVSSGSNRVIARVQPPGLLRTDSISLSVDPSNPGSLILNVSKLGYRAQLPRGRLFVIQTDEGTWDGSDFEIGERGTGNREQGEGWREIRFTPKANTPPSLSVTLLVKSDIGHQTSDIGHQTGELRLKLRIQNTAPDRRMVKISFPVLNGLPFLSDDPTETAYFHPVNGGVFGTDPVDIVTHFGNCFTQIMGIYIGERGTGNGERDRASTINDQRSTINGGFYLMTLDRENQFRSYEILKRVGREPEQPVVVAADWGWTPNALDMADGLGLAIHYGELYLEPGEVFDTTEVALGTVSGGPVLRSPKGEGGWREMMDIYQHWLRTWYRAPASSDWFRSVFSHRAIHERYFLADGQYSVEGVAFPGLQMANFVHWWDWINVDRDGRPVADTPEYWVQLRAQRGDYRIREDLGGAEGLRRFVDDLHREGVKVAFYLEGYLAFKYSDIGKAHGEEWAIMDRPGHYSESYVNEQENNWNLCPFVPGWQDYLAETVARVVRETGIDAVYIDSVGMRTERCFNPAHAAYHRYGEEWHRGVGQLLKRLRQALDEIEPGFPMYIEFCSSDVNMQYVNGSFNASSQGTAYFASFGLPLAPTGTNLMRFILPEFHLIDIPPAESEMWMKQAFFNGNGIHGFFDDPKSRELVGSLAKIYAENADAFCSDRPTPLIEVGGHVYANEWPGAGGKTVYTLWNYGQAPAEKVTLPIRVPMGARVVDLLTGQPLTFSRREGGIEVRLHLLPQELGCAAVLRGNGQ